MKKQETLKTFLDLVKIDSPSGEEEKIAEYIIKFLKREKIVVRKDKYGNLIAKLPGKGKPLILSAHMDTVEPGRGIKPVIKGNVIKSDGKTILGADNKAALAVILETVKFIKKKNIMHRPLEIVFTVLEEKGGCGAEKLSLSNLKGRECLILDHSQPLGYIIIAAPYLYVINIKIKGRAAHSGVEPEKGINAIEIASRAISNLKIGRINKFTTNNIGIIAGGSAMNVVPEEVLITAEARSFKKEEALRQIDLINKSFKKEVRAHKARLYFKSELLCSGYLYSPRNDEMIKKIVAINKVLKLQSVYEKAGGISDANVFVKKGLKAVNIAYGGRNAHTTKEYIKVSDMEKLKEFLTEFIRK